MSNKPLDNQQLDQIEARHQSATPGPWCTDAWEIYQGTEYVPGISYWIGETCRGTSTPEQDRADATFVAAARTDVPALLAEVRRLKDRVAELEVGEQPRCGRTRSITGETYPPCDLRPGHWQAYCRSKEGRAYFLGVDADQPKSEEASR